MMKKIRIITIIFLLSAGTAAGDDVGQALSGVAPESVMQSTRQLIQAGANRTSTIDVTRAMLQYGFTARQTLAAHAVLVNAHQQQLPLNAIISKAFEGMSKHVAAGSIVNAMQKVHARHSFAHQQAQEFASRKAQMNLMQHIIAASLAAGMTPLEFETIVQELQARSQHMKADQKAALAIETFKTARDMARLGVSSSQTASVVGKALQHEFTTAQMQAMRASFINDSRTTAPQSTAAGYASAIEQGKSFGGHVGATSGSGEPGVSGAAGDGGGGGGNGDGGGNGGGGNGDGGDGSGGDGGDGNGGGGGGGNGGGGGGGNGGGGGGGNGGGPGGNH
jgi:hypothetical protein